MEERFYCPDCGAKTLRVIESTEPDCTNEFKHVCTCDRCENMVHIFDHVAEEDPRSHLLADVPPS